MPRTCDPRMDILNTSSSRPPIADRAVDRESPGAGERQGEARCAEHELELIVRKSILELHQKNCPEHIADKSDSDEAGEEAEGQSDSPEKLEQGDKRT